MDIKINKNVIEVPVASLTAYEGAHKTESSIAALKQSITEFGFQQPIVIDKNNVVVAGNALLKAAQELGIDNVPCIRTDYLSEEQIQQYRIADNKTSEFARWNEKKLRKELSYLGSPQSLQYCFEDNILSMLGMDQKPKTPKVLVQGTAEQPTQKAKIVSDAEKDAKFKDEIRQVDLNLQAKPAEYYQYHCSNCGKLVKVKKNG